MSEPEPGRLTRQQLYDRIRESSKDEVILAEMIRLGFWSAEENRPSLPEAHIKRQGELQRELHQLAAQQRALEDPEQALALMRKQRLAESRRQRAENKRLRLAARHQRSLAWHHRRKSEILYLGEGISQELGNKDGDAQRLDRAGLPAIADAQGLARAMGIPLAELRFLTFSRAVSTVTHYQRFTIPKKTGGERLICAPMPRLKRAQYWILDNVLGHMEPTQAAHGFRKGRSICTNAAPHVGSRVVINIDLADFFPTITYPRIKGWFRAIGYCGEVATLLALLCSEPEVDEVELAGERLFVARGERRLPQGAPTSPAIANLLCRKLDRRIEGAVRKLGFRFTRYADDLSFSAGDDGVRRVGKLLWRVARIVESEGFQIRHDKTRIMRAGSRQEVTGVVVNERLSLERPVLRRFRAVLRQVERDGPEGKHWNGNPQVIPALWGYANFVRMVDANKGEPLVARVRALLEQHAGTAPAPHGLPRAAFRAAAARGEAPREGWWMPVEREAPVFEDPQGTGEPGAGEAASSRTPPAAGGQQGGSVLGRRFADLLRYAAWLAVAVVAFRISPFLGAAVLALYFWRAIR